MHASAHARRLQTDLCQTWPSWLRLPGQVNARPSHSSLARGRTSNVSAEGRSMFAQQPAYVIPDSTLDDVCVSTNGEYPNLPRVRRSPAWDQELMPEVMKPLSGCCCCMHALLAPACPSFACALSGSARAAHAHHGDRSGLAGCMYCQPGFAEAKQLQLSSARPLAGLWHIPVRRARDGERHVVAGPGGAGHHGCYDVAQLPRFGLHWDAVRDHHQLDPWHRRLLPGQWGAHPR